MWPVTSTRDEKRTKLAIRSRQICNPYSEKQLMEGTYAWKDLYPAVLVKFLQINVLRCSELAEFSDLPGAVCLHFSPLCPRPFPGGLCSWDGLVARRLSQRQPPQLSSISHSLPLSCWLTHTDCSGRGRGRRPKAGAGAATLMIWRIVHESSGPGVMVCPIQLQRMAE